MNKKQYSKEKQDALPESVSIIADDSLDDVFNVCRMNFESSIGYATLTRGLVVRKISPNDSSVIKHDIGTCFKSLYQALHAKEHVLSKSEFECLICFLLEYDNKDTSLILAKGYTTITSVKTRIKTRFHKSLHSKSILNKSLSVNEIPSHYWQYRSDFNIFSTFQHVFFLTKQNIDYLCGSLIR